METHVKAESRELVQIRETSQAAVSVQLHLLKGTDKILCIGVSDILLTEQQVKLYEKFLVPPFEDAKVLLQEDHLNPLRQDILVPSSSPLFLRGYSHFCNNQ